MNKRVQLRINPLQGQRRFGRVDVQLDALIHEAVPLGKAG